MRPYRPRVPQGEMGKPKCEGLRRHKWTTFTQDGFHKCTRCGKKRNPAAKPIVLEAQAIF